MRPGQFDHPHAVSLVDGRQLISHPLTGNLFIVSPAAGAPAADRTVDHVGEDHAVSFRDSLARLGAFSEPGFPSKPGRAADRPAIRE